MSIGRAGTAQIEGEIVIGRPVEEVFDFVADERNEPRFNRQMSSAELLTPEPIGSGSRFHVEMRMMRRTVDMTVEFTQFARPRLLGSTSRSVIRDGRGRAMLTSGTLTFEPVPRRHADALGLAGRDAGANEDPRTGDRSDGTPPGTADLGQPQAAPGRPDATGALSAGAAWVAPRGPYRVRCVLKKERMRRRASWAEGSW